MRHVVAVGLFLLAAGGCMADDAAKLTAEQAKKLLPEAAGVSFDPDALAQGKGLPKENRSPTYWVLTFAPAPGVPLPKDAEKDFDLVSGAGGVNPQEFLKALSPAGARGRASILQPDYITECTVKSDANAATGRVAFQCKAYSGSIDFKASRAGGGWVIDGFEWPHLGVRFTRGKDGNWSNEPIKK